MIRSHAHASAPRCGYDSPVRAERMGPFGLLDPVDGLRRGAGDEHGRDDRRELAEQAARWRRRRSGRRTPRATRVAEPRVGEHDLLDDRGDDAERDEDDADAEEQRRVAPVEPPRGAVDLPARAGLVDRVRLVLGPLRPPAQPDAEQRDPGEHAEHEPRRAQEAQVDAPSPSRPRCRRRSSRSARACSSTGPGAARHATCPPTR